MIIKIKEFIKGDFAENKDIARDIRVNKIMPLIIKDEVVILDFEGISIVTQSFIHALVSDIIRLKGSSVLEQINFENCNEEIKKIITIVTEYMQLAV